MGRVVVPKNRIDEVIRSLMTAYRVVAPVRNEGILEFKELTGNGYGVNVGVDDNAIVLTDEMTYKSPKEFLFPQVEKIISFDDSSEMVSAGQIKPTVIFGVKPCDLEAIKIITAIFAKGKFIDTCFIKRLENTIFIGMGCVSEKPGCFCWERGIRKGYSKDCDVFLHDNGGQYIAEVITEKGDAVLKAAGLVGVNSTRIGSASSTADACSESLPDGRTPEMQEKSPRTQDNILEIQADENMLFNKIDWERISEKCMACGTCTYICPTCHCFEFKDVYDKGTASRFRCWDSCMYPKFTLHASGHNPRASKKERYRQRVMHKYLYVKQNIGYTACTGCGRCIRSCPAGMNIKSVVRKIMEELK